MDSEVREMIEALAHREKLDITGMMTTLIVRAARKAGIQVSTPQPRIVSST